MPEIMIEEKLDAYTRSFIEELFELKDKNTLSSIESIQLETKELFIRASENNLTDPIIQFFLKLIEIKENSHISPNQLGFTKEDLILLAQKHKKIDEHEVTIGGRIGKAHAIVKTANARVKSYMEQKDTEAPSGIELWPRIQENIERIRNVLGMSAGQWDSYAGQLGCAIDSIDTLSKIIDLPESALKDIARVVKHYRMRLTPYYASLIMPTKINDPILLQSVPTGEMIDNVGMEIPPVAADHSPARLIDQFYPRVTTIKSTNMCAMYCTHCLRIAHIGKKDRVYSKEAYQEALNYIRNNKLIRDVLITGGDAFVLPNKILAWILAELDNIDHVRMKRLGTRIPVTCPQRIDEELLNILEKSNDIKPLRVVTQVNTAQEITPLSKKVFGQISKRVSAVMNQAVLLRGINDTNVKMWKLCETIQEAYIRPYYVFNCSFRNPQFAHLRVSVDKGREIIESMYGNISGDAIPRFIATAGGKIHLHKNNVRGRENGEILLKKPWNGEEVRYPDADIEVYESENFAFSKY